MIAAASCISSCRTAALRPQQQRVPCRRVPARKALSTRALLSPDMIAQIAEAAKPGSVDAPVGAIVLGAIVVTALSFAVSAGLKPGTDAAIQMQARDKRKFNKYDK